jgi:hypothetical protein
VEMLVNMLAKLENKLVMLDYNVVNQ